MSGIPRVKNLFPKPQDSNIPPKTLQKPLPDDFTRNKLSVRGRAKIVPTKEKKSGIVQIDENSIKKITAKPVKHTFIPEDKKIIHPNIINISQKKPINNDDSFKAEENENELGVKFPSPEKIYEKIKSGKISPSGNPRRGRSPPLREHFEAEMNKHGLLDKIVNIQLLNNFFESEIGGTKKEGSPHASDFGTSNSRLEKIFVENPDQTMEGKGFTFPFQKRARSNSPPRNGQLFDPKRSENTGNQPIVANFFIGQKVIRKELKKQIKFPKLEISLGENGGLSTLCTREEQGKMKSGLGEEDWMYQRLDAGGEKEQEKKIVGDEKVLLKLINQIADDCDDAD